MQNLKASKWRITLSNGHVVASSVMAHYFVLWTAHYFSSHRALLCPMDKTLLQVQWCTILPIGQNDVIGSMVNYFDWWMKCFLKFDCTMFHPVEKWCFKFIPALSPWQDRSQWHKQNKMHHFYIRCVQSLFIVFVFFVFLTQACQLKTSWPDTVILYPIQTTHLWGESPTFEHLC